MGDHSFSLDPRTILGVTPAASLDEIHDAFRSKSKKHHPDLGGDEWAFRMVARAYEVLKTTTCILPSKPWESSNAEVSATQNTSVCPDDFRVIEAELIWVRFESDGPTRPWSLSDESEETLSVCLVIAWPTPALVARAAESTDAPDVLRTLIDLFGKLRASASVVAGRSRIEDGRFVGWLSYPDVLTAQDAFLSLRTTLKAEGLTVKLQTVDERIPFAWRGASQGPIISAAS
jgi:DnaJ domain